MSEKTLEKKSSNKRKSDKGITERYSYILKNSIYNEHFKRIEEYEKDRIFCHHNYVHFLDVARIGMIINEKEGLGIRKDLIYAAALLHDIGRDVQYENGTPHEKASAIISSEILKESSFSIKEQEKIIKAISNHRNSKIKDKKNLSGVLYRADKLSRPCYFCKAEGECNWKNDKKNGELIW